MNQVHTESSLVEILWAERAITIEYCWVGEPDATGPLLVFLHEGLGSVSMWRDFPGRLCDALGCRGLVYSRPGYGRSTPRLADENWDVDFMHRQADEVLPALMKVLGLDTIKPWLIGHSDGGSIALLHAAHFPDKVAGVVVLSPHIMVEDISLKSIAEVRKAFIETDMRERLGRHHTNPESAFWGWNNIWLDPRFREWSIEEELHAIECPLLAIQGLDDEFGTWKQIRGIVRKAPQTKLLELASCGHSPHRDQPEKLISAIENFFNSHADKQETT